MEVLTPRNEQEQSSKVVCHIENFVVGHAQKSPHDFDIKNACRNN